MYKTIKTDLLNGVLTITLNRPNSMNAYTVQMNDELIDAYRWADSNDDVRVVIITGEGRAFCAGMDLSEGDQTFKTEESAEGFRDIGGQASLVLNQITKPVIAAINGPAVGIGLTMTLPMDIRVVKKDTKIGFVFSRRGIGPEAASGWFITKHVSVGKALEWMYTGRYIETTEAVMNGLVNEEVDDPYLRANEIAEEIVTHTAATSNSFTKQLIWSMLEENHPVTSHKIESKFLYWAARNQDAKEGIESFKEKRAPQFPLKASDLPNFIEEER